jgi:hypothetical protein
MGCVPYPNWIVAGYFFVGYVHFFHITHNIHTMVPSTHSQACYLPSTHSPACYLPSTMRTALPSFNVAT